MIQADTTIAVPRRFSIAGVPIDPVSTGQALDQMISALDRNTQVQVCTINVDFLVTAQRDAGSRAALERAELNVPDGLPVVWLGRLLGHQVPERVAGADIVPLLMEVAVERHGSVFMLGGEGGVAEEAAARLRERYPGLVVAGHYEPPRVPLAEMDHEAIIQRINQSAASILLVALGHPKQDMWIAQHRGRLNVSIAMGVGCCFDLIAGRSRRAPRWMQAAGLEWLYRMTREPSRLSARYLVDARWLLAAVPLVVWERLWHQATAIEG